MWLWTNFLVNLGILGTWEVLPVGCMSLYSCERSLKRWQPYRCVSGRFWLFGEDLIARGCLSDHGVKISLNIVIRRYGNDSFLVQISGFRRKRYFSIVRTMLTYSLLPLDIGSGWYFHGEEILRHCEDNASVFSVVSGYLIWILTLWSSMQMILWWHLVIAVTEILLRYHCLWLEVINEVEQNILLSVLVWRMGIYLCVKNWFGDGTWGSKDLFLCGRVCTEEFVWDTSFLNSRVTSLDNW